MGTAQYVFAHPVKKFSYKINIQMSRQRLYCERKLEKLDAAVPQDLLRSRSLDNRRGRGGSTKQHSISHKKRNSLIHALNGNPTTVSVGQPTTMPRRAVRVSPEGFMAYFAWCPTHHTISFIDYRPRYNFEPFIGPRPDPRWYWINYPVRADLYECHWCLSNIARNRAAHTTNGNTTSSSSPASVYGPEALSEMFLNKLKEDDGLIYPQSAAACYIDLVQEYGYDCGTDWRYVERAIRKQMGVAHMARDGPAMALAQSKLITCTKLYSIFTKAAEDEDSGTEASDDDSKSDESEAASSGDEATTSSKADSNTPRATPAQKAHFIFAYDVVDKATDKMDDIVDSGDTGEQLERAVYEYKCALNYRRMVMQLAGDLENVLFDEDFVTSYNLNRRFLLENMSLLSIKDDAHRVKWVRMLRGESSSSSASSDANNGDTTDTTLSIDQSPPTAPPSPSGAVPSSTANHTEPQPQPPPNAPSNLPAGPNGQPANNFNPPNVPPTPPLQNPTAAAANPPAGPAAPAQNAAVQLPVRALIRARIAATAAQAALPGGHMPGAAVPAGNANPNPGAVNPNPGAANPGAANPNAYLPPLAPPAPLTFHPAPVPQRVAYPDQQTISVNEWSVHNKCRIRNESVMSVFTFRTPDFTSNSFTRVTYVDVLDETVTLPSTYLDESRSFWSMRDHTLENYKIWQAQTSIWAQRLNITARQLADLMDYGPLIAFHHHKYHGIQTNETDRSLRSSMKISHNVRRITCASFAASLYGRFSVITGPFQSAMRHGVAMYMQGADSVMPYTFVAARSTKLTMDSTASLYPKFRISTNIYNKYFQAGYFSNHTTSVNQLTNAANSVFEQAKRFWNRVPSKPPLIQPVTTTTKATQFVYSSLLTSVFAAKWVNLVGTALKNFASVIISPLHEEVNRNPLSSLLYIALECVVTHTAYTAPLHVLNQALCSYGPADTYWVRVAIHVLFNLSMMYAGGPMASSLAPVAIDVVKGVRTYAMSTAPTKEVELARGAKMSFVAPRKMRSVEKASVVTIVGPVDVDYLPTAYAPTLSNEVEAVRARVLKKSPIHDPNTMQQFEGFVKHNYRKIFKHTVRTKWAAMSIHEYLEGSNASASVKKTIFDARVRVEEMGFSESERIPKELARKWTVRKGFVKVETANYRSPAGVSDKAPRLIQGATPEFISLVGPSIATLQNHVKRDLNKNKNIVFTSGVSVRDSAMKMFKHDTWLENDISAFDSSQHRQLMELECWLFAKLGVPPAVQDLMRANIDTRGFTSGGVKYSRKGGRKSGDPYTSLGNTIMNILIHLFAIEEATGYDIVVIMLLIVMLAQGDDALINAPGWLIRMVDWNDVWLRMGFKSEAIIRRNVYEAEFCSMRIVPIQDGHVFAPKVGRVIAKLGVMCQPPTNIPIRSLLRGTALSLRKACWPVPPLRSYIERILQLTSDVSRPVAAPVKEWQMKFEPCEESFDVWSTLHTVYRWDHTMQSMLDRELNSVTLTSLSVGPLFRYLCDADSNAPKDLMW